MDAHYAFIFVVSVLALGVALGALAVAISMSKRNKTENHNHFHTGDHAQVHFNQANGTGRVEAPYVRIEMAENLIAHLAHIQDQLNILFAHIEALERGDHTGDPLAAFKTILGDIQQTARQGTLDAHTGLDRAQGILQRNRSNGNGHT